MNTLIFLTSLIIMAVFMKKTIKSAVIGWYGFCMRGLAFGQESFAGLFWLAFQCALLYVAFKHVPFTIQWK